MGIESGKRSDSGTDGGGSGWRERLGSFADQYSNLHYFAVGGIAVGMIVIGLGSPAGGIVALIGLFGGVGALTLDLLQIRQHDSAWTPSVLGGIIGVLLLWFLYLPYYVYKRRKHVGL